VRLPMKPAAPVARIFLPTMIETGRGGKTKVLHFEFGRKSRGIHRYRQCQTLSRQDRNVYPVARCVRNSPFNFDSESVWQAHGAMSCRYVTNFFQHLAQLLNESLRGAGTTSRWHDWTFGGRSLAARRAALDTIAE
jgi:hypothetical protein